MALEVILMLNLHMYIKLNGLRSNSHVLDWHDAFLTA